jgi:phage protein U
MTGMMINLGGFPFMIETAPYQELTRQTSWKWPEQELIGTTPAMQYTGKNADTMTLRGMLVPGFTGGTETITALRLLGDLGTQLPLIGGNGFFFGLWVLESIEQGEDLHFSDGSPRRMTFTVQLKKSADALTAIKGAVNKLKQIPSLFS